MPNNFKLMFANKNLENLLMLDLSYNRNVDDKVIKTIAKNCPKLKILEIKECELIHDKGIEAVVKHCNKIQKLGLSGILKLTNKFLCEINVNLPELHHLGTSINYN